MNRQQAEQIYKKMGLKIRHVFDKPGTIYAPHSHGKVYLYSLSGSLKIKLDDAKWRTIGPNQQIVIERGQLHEAIVGEDGWEYIFAWDIEEATKYGK